MRNIKKLLALVLSLVMTMSLIAVANAANYQDMSSVEHVEAVTLMTDLDILTGYTDGTFKPENTVTRAEMAAMLTRAALGSKAEEVSTQGLTAKLSDVATAAVWAQPYIGYCYTMGYINGYPDGTFRPNQEVNTVEAACMILKALGYNKADEFSTEWTTTVMSTALSAGLLSGLAGVNATAPLTRDDACQMVYNALFAQTKTYTEALGYLNNGTMAHSVFGLDSVTGVITGVDADAIYINGVKYAGITTDFTNIGLTATFYAKFATTTATGLLNTTLVADTTKCLGVYSSEVTLVNAPVATVDDGTSLTALTNKYSTSYVASLDTTVAYYLNGAATTRAALSALVAGDTLNLIDNDADGLIDVVTAFKYVAGQVSYYNAATEVVTIGSQSFKFENVVGVENIAKGDYVYYYTHGTTAYVYPAAKITGQVTNYSSLTGAYVVAGASLYVSGHNLGVALTVGSSYDVFVDSNGYILAADLVKISSEYLYGIDNSAYNVHTKLTDAVVAFANGTTGNITISGIGAGTNNYQILADRINGNVYSYTVDANGCYVLTPVGATEGWYSFTAGTITNNALTATMNGAKRVDASTLFIDVATGLTYTGYAAVPSMVNVDGWYMLDEEGVVSIVFVGDRDTTLAPDTFAVFSTAYEQDSAYANTYIYTVVINSEICPIYVNAAVHALIQANGVGLYDIVSSSNDVVTGAVSHAFALDWEAITSDRNGRIDTATKSLRKSSSTTYIVFNVEKNTAVVCTDYTQAVAMVNTTSLVGQMAIVSADVSGNYAESVYIVTGYSAMAPSVEFTCAAVYGETNNAFYGPNGASVVATVTALPGAVVTIDGTNAQTVGATGVVYYELNVTESIDADFVFTATMGSKAASTTKHLSYNVVYPVAITGDLADAVEVSSVVEFDGVKYVLDGDSVVVRVTVNGTVASYSGVCYHDAAAISFNGTEYAIDPATAGMSVVYDVAANTYTATFSVAVTDVDSAEDVTFVVNAVAGAEVPQAAVIGATLMDIEFTEGATLSNSNLIKALANGLYQFETLPSLSPAIYSGAAAEDILFLVFETKVASSEVTLQIAGEGKVYTETVANSWGAETSHFFYVQVTGETVVNEGLGMTEALTAGTYNYSISDAAGNILLIGSFEIA